MVPAFNAVSPLQSHRVVRLRDGTYPQTQAVASAMNIRVLYEGDVYLLGSWRTMDGQDSGQVVSPRFDSLDHLEAFCSAYAGRYLEARALAHSQGRELTATQWWWTDSKMAALWPDAASAPTRAVAARRSASERLLDAGSDDPLLCAVTRMAHARIILATDPGRAQTRACEAFDMVASHAWTTCREGGGPPTILRHEPALLLAYAAGAECARRGDAIYAQRDSDVAAQMDEAGPNHDADPAADDLFAEIKAGRGIYLNGHSLEYDEEFGVMAGTNDYGVDYYYGAPTLANVTAWLAEMKSGWTIGDHPPEPDYPDGSEDDFERWCAIEEEAWAVAKMRGVEFDDDLISCCVEQDLLLGRAGVLRREWLDQVLVEIEAIESGPRDQVGTNRAST